MVESAVVAGETGGGSRSGERAGRADGPGDRLGTRGAPQGGPRGGRTGSGRTGGCPDRRASVWWWGVLGLVVTCLSGGGPSAALPAAGPASIGQPARSDHVLIVTGASGTPEHAARFDRAATQLADALVAAGVPASNVRWLAEDPARTGGRASARSTKVELEKALAALGGRVRSGDHVLLLLVGHGSHEGAAARINLPGPDITAAELATALAPLAQARVAVVNAASASGDFLPVLSARGRIVITATKSSLERNETRFPEVFVSAFRDAVADTDKDGRVSLLEAFEFTRIEVARLYEKERHLLTEHAQLDDDGDGRGTSELGGSGEGGLARAFVLGGRAQSGAGAVAGGAGASTDPRAARLLAERDSLERSVAALRARKAEMESAAYDRELERLLVEVAERTRALRALEGTPP